jgi:hypothetical protein
MISQQLNPALVGLREKLDGSFNGKVRKASIPVRHA